MTAVRERLLILQFSHHKIFIDRDRFNCETDLQGVGGGGIESAAYDNPGLTDSTESVQGNMELRGSNTFMGKFLIIALNLDFNLL